MKILALISLLLGTLTIAPKKGAAAPLKLSLIEKKMKDLNLIHRILYVSGNGFSAVLRDEATHYGFAECHLFKYAKTESSYKLTCHENYGKVDFRDGIAVLTERNGKNQYPKGRKVSHAIASEKELIEPTLLHLYDLAVKVVYPYP